MHTVYLCHSSLNTKNQIPTFITIRHQMLVSLDLIRSHLFVNTFFQIYVRVIKIDTDRASSVSSLYVINRIHLLLCLFLLKPNWISHHPLIEFLFVFVFEFLQVKINRSINMTYKYIDTIVDFFVRNEGKSQQINSMLFKSIDFLSVLSSAAHV